MPQRSIGVPRFPTRDDARDLIEHPFAAACAVGRRRFALHHPLPSKTASVNFVPPMSMASVLIPLAAASTSSGVATPVPRFMMVMEATRLPNSRRLSGRSGNRQRHGRASREAVAGAADVHRFLHRSRRNQSLGAVVHDQHPFRPFRDEHQFRIRVSAQPLVIHLAEQRDRGGIRPPAHWASESSCGSAPREPASPPK